MTEGNKGCAECTPSGSGNCTFGCFAEPGARPYDKGEMTTRRQVRTEELARLREIADAFAERQMFDERDVVLDAADRIEAMNRWDADA